MEKKEFFQLIFFILLCQLTGILGSFITIDAIPIWFATLNKPWFNLPNWLFGPVWTLLYAFMGVSIYLIWQMDRTDEKVKYALKLFFIQLFLNGIWTPLFFGIKRLDIALLEIILLWVCIVLTIKAFYPLSKKAAWLLVPYFLWVSFATVLNASILYLN